MNNRQPTVVGMPLTNVNACMYALQIRTFTQHKHINTGMVISQWHGKDRWQSISRDSL